MITANFYLGKTRLPYFRQTFGATGAYRNVQFDINNLDADWQIVSSPMPDLGPIEGKKILYAQLEPPEFYLPSLEQIKKCKAVVTPFGFNVPDTIDQFLAPPCLQWMYGMRTEMKPGVGHVFHEDGYAGLEEMMMAKCPVKTRVCSLIVSGKGFLPGHKIRLEFAQRVVQHFGKKIDYFGFGFNPIGDKREVIDPYLFSIALENCTHNNYFTEKITDVYLGYAMPIYYGAPNITEFFPAESMLRIDLANADEAIAKIENLIANPNQYNTPGVMEARRRVLLEYNSFDLMARVLEEMEARLAKARQA